ncbi:MAG: hypothetical protein CBC29_06500 [Methylococcaceae bacterium TMED69]|nr:MAG: hypothetical protein CBC29_06500 [Methylococcaceae bacterium TMED69]|tara:strand:- start:2045 stop:2503 length:459 start_codon:yes stop_codon:yes gene_type:complete
MKITKRQLRRIIKETLVTESLRVTWPFQEIADYFQERGYKATKAHAGDARGSARFQLPITIKGGSRDLGYYVDVKYEYGTFYFYWFLRTKQPNGRIKVMRPGGGKPRWEVEYRESDLKVVMDEIDYEISVHDDKGTHPFDLGLPTSRFAFQG